MVKNLLNNRIRKDITAGYSRNTAEKQQGLTLIEVMVALLILVVGIFSVMRLFPSGFSLVRTATNTTAANHLCQQAIETLKTGSGAPDGIYSATNPNGSATWQFDPTVSPLVKSLGVLDNTVPTVDLTKFKYIDGETFTIASPKSFNGIPIHVLNYGPIVANPPSCSLLKVRTVDWNPIIKDSGYANVDRMKRNQTYDRPGDYLVNNKTEYLIDYQNGYLAVQPQVYAQHFLLTVTGADGKAHYFGFTVHANNAPIEPFPGSYDYWFNLTDSRITLDSNLEQTPPSLPWVIGSAQLYRPLQYTGGAFSEDPCEYSLVNTNDFGMFNFGALSFNPRAAALLGRDALTVKASYEVVNWNILHEDFDIPNTDTGASPVIHLSMLDLKKIGDVQQDGAVYNGLIPNKNVQFSNYDIALLNLDDGSRIDSTHGLIYNDDDTSTASGSIHVSFKNGRITLPSSITATHIRVFYAGTGDWAVGLQKAPKSYNILSTDYAGAVATLTTPSATPPNICCYDVSTNRFWFPNCDQNKTITLYNVSYTDTNNVTRNLSSKDVLLSETFENASNDIVKLNLVNPTNKQYLISINLLNLYKQEIIGTATSFTIGAVGGKSIRAITIWREKDNKWKKCDIEDWVKRS